MKKNDLLRLVFGDDHLGLYGQHYRALFSYSRGGLSSLRTEGKEWIYRPVQPTYWRATTDNDRGAGFHLQSAQWMGADMFCKCVGVTVSVDGKEISSIYPPENDCFGGEIQAERVDIAYRYETLTVPCTGVTVTYGAQRNGGIHICAKMEGSGDLPPLPCFGLRLVMPTAATGFTYEGLSGETYPDRKAGAERGVFTAVGMPVTPYLVPQECGMHMDTHWLTVTRDRTLNNADKSREPFSLRFRRGEQPFAFSCLPYTAQELESAWHREDLPPVRWTVLCLYGAVRGVGGVNSWGTGTLEPYRIDTTKDIFFDFYLDLQ